MAVKLPFHITHIIWEVDVATVCTQSGITAIVANANQLQQDLSMYNKKTRLFSFA